MRRFSNERKKEQQRAKITFIEIKRSATSVSGTSNRTLATFFERAGAAAAKKRRARVYIYIYTREEDKRLLYLHKQLPTVKLVSPFLMVYKYMYIYLIGR